jgi:glycosyltransferase involved in cell wall biosynthesis
MLYERGYATFAAEGLSDVRILHLANHCGKANGHVNVSVDMACTQAKNGHHIGYASSGGDFIGLMQDFGVEIFFIPQPHRSLTGYFRANLALARTLRQFKPDVVHIHMAAQSALMQPFRMLGYKTVTTVHNEFDRSAWLMGLATRVVTVSYAYAERLRNKGTARKRVRTVLNGSVGSPRLPAKFSPAQLEHPAILTVCGMHHRKGVPDLLRGFQIVHQEFPAARLYLTGEGPSLVEYQALAKELGIAEATSFLGFHHDPREYLYAADIFVLASHAEPGPLAIAEARGAGCAIVATNVDGIPEMLDHGAAGILVPPHQPESIAKALLQLLSEPETLAGYAAVAKQNTDRFTINRVCREMDDIYQEIC